MRLTQLISPTRLRAQHAGAPMIDFDSPAYTRAGAPLVEIERRQAAEAAERQGASNRTFNRQFWSTMASEAGGVPTGIVSAQFGRWVSRMLGRPGRLPRLPIGRGDSIS